jgi:hypothetical protein
MIHRDLQIKSDKEVISENSAKYINKLNLHPNHLAVNLLDNRGDGNRLKRCHIIDPPERFNV